MGSRLRLSWEGSEVEQEVGETGRDFHGFQCDFSDRRALYAFIKDVKDIGKPIDILVNNAGTILREPAANHPDEYWDKVIEVNLNAQFVLSREFGKDMVERGSGKIVFTASLLTFQGGITVPGYAASKGGIGQLTMALANEWASKGVNVNAIAPGYIATDNTEALRNDPERSVSILSRIPAGRWGRGGRFQGSCRFSSVIGFRLHARDHHAGRWGPGWADKLQNLRECPINQNMRRFRPEGLAYALPKTKNACCDAHSDLLDTL